MKKRDLAGYQKLLEERRTELLSVLRSSARVNRHEDHVGEDDQPMLLHEESVATGLNNLSYEQLLLVEQALARIESGDYGDCAGCGEAIPPKRLRAMPWAKYCVACAEREDLKQDASRDVEGNGEDPDAHKAA